MLVDSTGVRLIRNLFYDNNQCPPLRQNGVNAPPQNLKDSGFFT